MTNGYRSPGHDPESQDPVLRYTAFQRSIGHAMVGSIFGAFLSPFLSFLVPQDELLRYAARLGLTLSGWSLTLVYAVIGAVLGVLFEVPRGLIGDAHRRRRIAELREVAPRTSVRVGAAPAPGLDEKLGEIFPGSLRWMGNVAQVEANGTSIAVADVSCEARADSDTVRQTVAYYEPDGLRLPTFTLQPQGRMVSFIAHVAGIVDIDFPSHPAFSRAYLLSAALEDDVRRLFNDRVLAELGGSPGFHLESVGNGLALVLPRQLLAGEELKGFLGAAARIFRVLEESGRRAGFTKARVPPKRDVKAMFEKMPGLGGAEARKSLVTRADAEAFARQTPPRRVPANIALYAERFAPRLAVGMGAAFVLAGVFFALVFANQALSSGKGLWNSDWFGVVFGLLFVAFGSPMAFFFGRRRFRIARVLRKGRVAPARIEKVETADESVNKVELALLTVVYRHEGREVRASCKIVGPGKERAEKLAAARKPAAILHDPADPERIVFVDDLISVGTDFEP